MDEREKRIARLVAVQTRLREVAEWRLAALGREEAERTASQHDLLAALNSEDAFHGALAEAMSRKIGRLSLEVQGLKRQQVIQGRRVLEEGLRLKLSERMATSAGNERRKTSERRALQDLYMPPTDDDEASLP